MANVVLQAVSKVYPGGVTALSAVDLEIANGELFVALGPSGSGKSTLLRLIAGLEDPSAGSIWIGGKRVDDLPPRDRDVAMVFQTPALYPHLNVFENLAFGLRARSVPKGKLRSTVSAVAERLGIAGVLDRMPRTLSGGQRQRVALGRAIAREPRVFLLDEPFSSLDAPLRASMRAELAELHRRLGTTTILVTHDQAEAMMLGNRVAVVEAGQIVQVGSPTDIYDRPANRFVATFIGQPPMSCLPCAIERAPEGWRIKFDAFESTESWSVPHDSRQAPALSQLEGRPVELGLRPETISPIEANQDADATSPFVAANLGVQRLDRLGHETLATVSLGPFLLNLRLPPHDKHAVGDILSVRIDLRRASWFERGTGTAIQVSSMP